MSGSRLHQDPLSRGVPPSTPGLHRYFSTHIVPLLRADRGQLLGQVQPSGSGQAGITPGKQLEATPARCPLAPLALQPPAANLRCSPPTPSVPPNPTSLPNPLHCSQATRRDCQVEMTLATAGRQAGTCDRGMGQAVPCEHTPSPLSCWPGFL